MNLGPNIDLREYWQRVREIQRTLPAIVYVIAEPSPAGDPGGVVCECDAETAARLIFARTHRIAGEAEIEAWRERQEAERKRIAEIEYKRKQNFALPPEVANLIEVAVRRARDEDKPERRGRSRNQEAEEAAK